MMRMRGTSDPAEMHDQDSLAEWFKALASGFSPQGRGFEPHSCHMHIEGDNTRKQKTSTKRK